MKFTFISLTIFTGLLLAGCSTAPTANGLMLDAVGPAQSPPPTTRATDTTGSLVVYSAYRRNADFNARDPYRPEYSDYEIFSSEGAFQQRIHNNSDTILQSVVPVALPAGQYKVKVRANGYGYVIVPVVIVPGQTTTLHLEGDGNWPNPSIFNQTNAVRLPDGIIVGWKADLTTLPSSTIEPVTK